jgi:hypothetical protein
VFVGSWSPEPGSECRRAEFCEFPVPPLPAPRRLIAAVTAPSACSGSRISPPEGFASTYNHVSGAGATHVLLCMQCRLRSLARPGGWLPLLTGTESFAHACIEASRHRTEAAPFRMKGRSGFACSAAESAKDELIWRGDKDGVQLGWNGWDRGESVPWPFEPERRRSPPRG